MRKPKIEKPKQPAEPSVDETRQLVANAKNSLQARCWADVEAILAKHGCMDQVLASLKNHCCSMAVVCNQI